MNTNQKGRYSAFIKPIVVAIDLIIVLFFAIMVFYSTIFSGYYILLVGCSWFIAVYFTRFYQVYRITKPVEIISLLLKQTALFSIIVFALAGYHYHLELVPQIIFKYVGLVFATIAFFKASVYFLLKKYRKYFNGNYRKVAILGKNKQSIALENFFKNNLEYGYKLCQTFSLQGKANLEGVFKFVLENRIDELYCSISSLTDKEIYEIITFADNNLVSVKFIPDTKKVIFRNFKYEYYNYTPILSLRSIPLNEPFNQFIKRIFDVVFSLLIITFLLSWLVPILAVIIRIESKGSIFFKQSRNGINNKEFMCYKFRSMKKNETAHIHQATKNDMRITRVGKFIRKTSIDELPQFFNVLLGDMSVVGPRPHMVSHTKMYAKSVNKFMVRHFVKPGITGMAQVSGFRGEIETEKDIVNRVKYDIFYIENWSILLDLKIIFLTFYNALKGEDKAY